MIVEIICAEEELEDALKNPENFFKELIKETSVTIAGFIKEITENDQTED